MAMDLNAKAAYIRGLMTGMDFDADSKNGKVIAAMMDLLEEMAAQVTEHDNALDQVYDELETLDQDLDDVVSDIYADEDEDDDLPPPVVRKPAPRPVTPPPVYEEEDEYEEPSAEPVEEVPAAPVRKPAQVIRRTPVHRSRPQREPMMQPLDDEPLVEPAYAQAPTFGAREPAPQQQARYAQPVSAYEEPDYDDEPAYEEPVQVAEPVQELPPVEKIWQDVYVINLMARPGHDLQGATLLSSLLALGFKFGEMDIFHRHEDLGGKGEVLFSMINMVKPGTFNPYRMEQFSTPGVSLFMQLPLRSNAAFAFEHMLQAADQLASDLDAMLTDASRSPLSDDDIARYRHELAAYEASRD